MKDKVLIVDDDGQLGMLAEILQEDYEITEADSGAALQKSFAGAQPDVIVLDYILQDDNGLELLPQIKKQWPDTEVIMFTGNAHL